MELSNLGTIAALSFLLLFATILLAKWVFKIEIIIKLLTLNAKKNGASEEEINQALK